jgi:hypothetical protein
MEYANKLNMDEYNFFLKGGIVSTVLLFDFFFLVIVITRVYYREGSVSNYAYCLDLYLMIILLQK